VVDDEPGLPAQPVRRLHSDAFGGVELRHEVRRDVLDEVDLARDESVRGGLRVGNVLPDEAVEMDDLAAGRFACGFRARHIVRVLLVNDLAAGHPFVLQNPERPRAGHLLDLLVRIGHRDPLRHHEGHIRVLLAERSDGQSPGVLERHHDGAVVRRHHGIDPLHEELSEHVALAPALDGRHAVLGGHRSPVMPVEAVAERDGVNEPVVAQGIAFGHLRLDVEIRIRGEQRVIDRIAVIAGDERGGPDRVDVLQIRVDRHIQLGLTRRREGEGEAERRRRHDALRPSGQPVAR